MVIFGIIWFYIELSHCSYEGPSAVQHVFINGQPIECEFVDRVAVLMDNLHLFDNCRLATFARPYVGVSMWLSLIEREH